MGESNLMVTCKYCTGRHRPRFLCDPARRVLDALLKRGMQFDMPTLEFPEAIPMQEQGALGSIDALIAQLVVKAACVDVAGVRRPALVFTGRSAHGAILPSWLYAGDSDDIRRVCALVRDVGEMAIRRAGNAATDVVP